jgi:hypothetical protein
LLGIKAVRENRLVDTAYTIKLTPIHERKFGLVIEDEVVICSKVSLRASTNSANCGVHRLIVDRCEREVPEHNLNIGRVTLEKRVKRRS